MIRRRIPLLALAIGLVLPGCATGDDAVVTGGGEFRFVAPDGQTEIVYDEPDRQSLELSGEDLFAEGETLSTADFAGEVVVLNIWGQWCGPCRREAPQLQQVYEQTRRDGVTVFGIDVRDYSREAPQDFMRDRGLTYPSIYDPPGRSLLALKGYPRNVVPSTIVLDREHRVAAVFLKEISADDLLPLVNRLTKE